MAPHGSITRWIILAFPPCLSITLLPLQQWETWFSPSSTYVFICSASVYMHKDFRTNLHLPGGPLYVMSIYNQSNVLSAAHVGMPWFRGTPFLGHCTRNAMSALGCLSFSWSILPDHGSASIGSHSRVCPRSKELPPPFWATVALSVST